MTDIMLLSQNSASRLNSGIGIIADKTELTLPRLGAAGGMGKRKFWGENLAFVQLFLF